MSWVWPNFVASFWLSGAWAGWHLAWNLADFERLLWEVPQSTEYATKTRRTAGRPA